MNRRTMAAIMRKDLKVVAQSKAVLIPMIVLPLVLIIVLPLILGLTVRGADPTDPNVAEVTDLLRQLPPGLLDEFRELSIPDQALLYFLLYFFAPLFLILPLMVASVIAADSFAGERERKTLEALLYTPTSDQELYVAKVLSPWAAALVITLLAFVAYALVVNAIGLPVVGHIFFPNVMWIVLALWVAPAAAGLGLGTMVLVSSRVNTFQEAYQLGGIVVVPILLLVFGQIGGLVFFSVPFVLLVGLILWAADLAILWFGARIFTRGALLSRL